MIDVFRAALFAKPRRLLLLILGRARNNVLSISQSARRCLYWLLSLLQAHSRHGGPDSADPGPRARQEDANVPTPIAAALVPPSARTTRYSPLHTTDNNPFDRYDSESRPSSRYGSEDGKLDLIHGRAESESHVAVEMIDGDRQTAGELPIVRHDVSGPPSVLDGGQPNVAQLLEELTEAGLRPMHPHWINTRTRTSDWAGKEPDTPRRRIPRGPFRSHAEVDADLGLLTPPGWIELTTPHGQPYFLNSTSHIITDTYIRGPATFHLFSTWEERVLKLIQELQQLPDERFLWPEKWELFLRADGEEKCEYYLVSGEERQVFWFENLRRMLPKESGWWPAGRIDLWLETLYWCHIAGFPHEATPDVDNELKDMLLSARLDMMTFPGSALPFSETECNNFLNDLSRFEEYKAEPVVKTAYVARLMRAFCHTRLHYHYASEHACVDHGQLISLNPSGSSPEGATKNRLLALPPQPYRVLLALLTLGATELQLSKLSEATGGGSTILPESWSWRLYVDHSAQQAKEQGVLSAIILVTNTVFLALPSLSSQILTLQTLSTLWASASFLSSLLLLHNLPSRPCSPVLHPTPWTLIGHVFLHSLPLAFLLLSLLCLAVSVTLYCGLQVLGGGASLGMLLAFALGLGGVVVGGYWAAEGAVGLLGSGASRRGGRGGERWIGVWRAVPIHW